MALKLTGNLTRKWNMLEYTVLLPQDLGTTEETPTGLFQRARLSHLAGEPELSAAAAEAQLEWAPPGTCSYQRRWGGRKH